MRMRLATPAWGLATACLVCALGLPAAAQPKKGPPKAVPAAAPAAPDGPTAKKDSKDPKKEKTFDFTGVNLNGQNRTPQLLYFLERANEELERASLEKRSFIPHMVRSIEEEAL